MDEAMSHKSLDALQSSSVQDAMRKAMQGRTSIIIAHRLSTIRCRQDSSPFRGKLVEQGTHDELISIKGHYFKLFNASNGEHGEENVKTTAQLS